MERGVLEVITEMVAMGKKRFGSEAAFARAVNLPPSALSQVKTGRRELKLDEGITWCRVLGVSADDMFGLPARARTGRPLNAGVVYEKLDNIEGLILAGEVTRLIKGKREAEPLRPEDVERYRAQLNSLLDTAIQSLEKIIPAEEAAVEKKRGKR